MKRYYLRTLGHLSLHEEDREGEVVLSDAKALAALAYLADTPDGSGDRAHLAELLWPGKDPSRARAGLRQALYYLRRKTEDGVSVVRSDELRVALDRRTLGCDLWEFEEAVAREEWESVLDLHDGPFLGGYRIDGAREFGRWRDGRDDGLRAGLRQACRVLVSRGLEGSDPGAALLGARRWVEMNPLDERAQLALIRSLAATGDRAAAFRAYESYHTLLREELGESPGPRFSGVLQEIRSGAGGLGTGGAGRSSGPDSRDDGRAGGVGPRHTGIRRGAAAAVLALAVVLVAAAGWRLILEGRAADEAPAAELEIVVRTGLPDRGAAVRVIHWAEDGVRVEEGGAYPAGGVPAPDGRRVAVSVPTADGVDLGLVDSSGGEPRRLTGRAADEAPVAWSPDGRRILYDAGREESDGDYVRRYRVRHLDDGADVGLGLPFRQPAGAPPEGEWSPLGTAVAVVSDTAGNLDVWRVAPDGSDARNLTSAHAGYDGEPSWAPGAGRLAFVSDRSGSRDVWMMDADGSEPRRITYSRRAETGPVWLSPRRLGYFRHGDDGAEFRSVDLVTSEDRVLARLPGCEKRFIVGSPDAAAPWIASVELPGHLARVAPGQWIRRRAVVRGSDGGAIPVDAWSLRWSVADTSVLDPAAGSGWLRVRGTGRTPLRVSAAGWRSDSLRVRSRTPEAREAPPALAEDWSGGIDTARWVPVGDPPPAVVRPGGRFPAAFLNRGDENYHSGVVSRRPLRAGRGLTVEFWGRSPLTAPLFQGLMVGFVPEPPRRGLEVWGASDAVVEVSSGAEVPDSLGVRLEGRLQRVPAPDSLAAWHRYTLQVGTDGRVSLLVDGRMHWRSAGTVEPGRLEGTHLGLYGRSKGTRILHGPVRVWEGVRYRLP